MKLRWITIRFGISLLASTFLISHAHADDTLYQSLNHASIDFSIQNYKSADSGSSFLPSTSESAGLNFAGQYYLFEHVLLAGAYYTDLFGATDFGKLDYNYNIGAKLFYQYSPGSLVYFEGKTGQFSISRDAFNGIQTTKNDYNSYSVGIDMPFLSFAVKKYQFNSFSFQTITYDMRLNSAQNDDSSWLGYATGQGGTGIGLTFGLEYPLSEEGISEGHIGLSYAF